MNIKQFHRSNAQSSYSTLVARFTRTMIEQYSSANWSGLRTPSFGPPSPARSQDWLPNRSFEQNEIRSRNAMLSDGARHPEASGRNPSSSSGVDYTHPHTPDRFESDSERLALSHVGDLGDVSSVGQGHTAESSSRSRRVDFIRGVASGGRSHTGESPDDRPSLHFFSPSTLVASELIGKGGFGRVYRGRHAESGQVLAMKLIPRFGASSRVSDSVLRERDIGQCISEAKAKVGGQVSRGLSGLAHLLGAFLAPECIVLVTVSGL